MDLLPEAGGYRRVKPNSVEATITAELFGVWVGNPLVPATVACDSDLTPRCRLQWPTYSYTEKYLGYDSASGITSGYPYWNNEQIVNLPAEFDPPFGKPNQPWCAQFLLEGRFNLPSGVTIDVNNDLLYVEYETVKIYITPKYQEPVDHAGFHTGGTSSTLTDSAASFGDVDSLVGLTIKNLTDGSEGDITANTATTVTVILSGGTSDQFSLNDTYAINVSSGYYYGFMDRLWTFGEDNGFTFTATQACSGVSPNIFGTIYGGLPYDLRATASTYTVGIEYG